MKNPRPKLLFFAIAALAVAACAYDWTVGAAPDDAGAGTDAAFDAGVDARSIEDASLADGSIVDAGAGADARSLVDAPSQCAALGATLASTRASAQLCQLATDCTVKITYDECTCETWLSTSAPTPSSDYTSALAAFEDAGCPRPTNCPVECLNPAGAACAPSEGGVTRCYPDRDARRPRTSACETARRRIHARVAIAIRRPSPRSRRA